MSNNFTPPNSNEKKLYAINVRLDETSYNHLEKMVQQNAPLIRNKAEAVRHIIDLSIKKKLA